MDVENPVTSNYQKRLFPVSASISHPLHSHLLKFLSTLPGEKNTALLASTHVKSSGSPTVESLGGVIDYDYIIVGTGTAGCVLASRLTEDSAITVLAIEAGESDAKQIMSRIPAGLTRLWGSPVDWGFHTTAQPECSGRKLEWPRGKMIGGSSSMNAMMYNKGAPDDYDEWERLGNKGWAYKDVAPYLKKSENFRQPKDEDERKLNAEDLAQHGSAGPWNITYPYQADITKVFPDGCAAVGIPKTSDVNTDRGILGATAVQTFIDNSGVRSSTAAAYLTADVLQRPNLKIASGQNVTRIIFDSSGPQPRAVGVEMAASKISPLRYLAKAKKEVLISAGSIGTPHLLKLSGIGHVDELKEYEIPLVKELPGVGENLMDHMAFHGVTFKTEKGFSLHYLQDPIKSIPELVQWLRDGTGKIYYYLALAASKKETIQ
jgi:choline dehydrogenase